MLEAPVGDGPRGLPIRFSAMASDWEVHLPSAPEVERLRVGAAVTAEVRRIEQKYSRYRPDSITQALNTAGGAPIAVDSETARLIDYAAALWRASCGLFDLTTGALRRVWTFDGSDRVPDAADIAAVRAQIGWDKIEWDGETLRMPAGMELDFGGIGKEYAVDRALAIASGMTRHPVLVNGGGDLAANAPPATQPYWQVGIDTGHAQQGSAVLGPAVQLLHGALATSGDARRFLLRDGVRYSHVLDPRDARPVVDAPHSVTVLADTCSEAGSHATLAMLHGRGAEAYLQGQGVRHWIFRGDV